jgi:hypothetical protein
VLTAMTPLAAPSARGTGGAIGRSPRGRAPSLLRLRRRLPDRLLVAVMDGGFATLELLDALSPHMLVVTRLRLDACLFDPPSAEQRLDRPAAKGSRQPTLQV